MGISAGAYMVSNHVQVVRPSTINSFYSIEFTTMLLKAETAKIRCHISIYNGLPSHFDFLLFQHYARLKLNVF